MVRGIKELKNRSPPETTFFCLSGANQVYVNTIFGVRTLDPLTLCYQIICLRATSIQAHGLTELFDEIVTNPAEWDADNILRIRRLVSPDGPQHNCPRHCDVSMCKGQTYRQDQAILKTVKIDLSHNRQRVRRVSCPKGGAIRPHNLYR
jgi:pyridoxal phosphate phosphatase PHOSPHO2